MPTKALRRRTRPSLERRPRRSPEVSRTCRRARRAGGRRRSKATRARRIAGRGGAGGGPRGRALLLRQPAATSRRCRPPGLRGAGAARTRPARAGLTLRAGEATRTSPSRASRRPSTRRALTPPGVSPRRARARRRRRCDATATVMAGATVAAGRHGGRARGALPRRLRRRGRARGRRLGALPERRPSADALPGGRALHPPPRARWSAPTASASPSTPRSPST